MNVNISYDREADAAYLSFVDTIGPGEAARQVAFIETPNGESQLNIDFDVDGHLLGLEILVASRALPPELQAGSDPE